jgi:hypothetical protein
MSGTHRNQELSSSEEKMDNTAFLLTYSCPVKNSSIGETHSTESTDDDGNSSVSSISMDSILIHDDLSVENLSDDNESAECGDKIKDKRSKSPAFATSMVVVSSKKKSRKKSSNAKPSKSLNLEDADVDNMRFDHGFNKKASMFRESAETTLQDMEVSSNSLLKMFDVIKRNDSGNNTGSRAVSHFNGSSKSMEFEDVDNKLHYYRTEHDAKSRQSRKSTKSKKSTASKSKRNEPSKAKEYEDAITTNPRYFSRKDACPTILHPDPDQATTPLDAPIKFRSSRMLTKPSDIRSVHSEDLSSLEGFDLNDDDRIRDAKSIHSIRSTSNSIQQARLPLQVREERVETVDPSLLPLLTPPAPPIPRRSFFNRAISNPIFKWSSADKEDPSLELGSEHRRSSAHERSTTPTRSTRPTFTERLRAGVTGSERHLRIKSLEGINGSRFSQRGGFTGLLDELDEEEPKLRSNSLDTLEGMAMEESMHSAKTPRRRGSLGGIGAMVMGSLVPTSLIPTASRASSMTSHPSSRIPETPEHGERTVPTSRRSVRSLGSLGSTSKRDDLGESRKTRKSSRADSKNAELGEGRKTGRSQSINKPPKRSMEKLKPSARSLGSVGSLGYESMGKTTDNDDEDNDNTDKQIKPRRSKSIENGDHSKGRTSGRGQSVEKSAKRTIERLKPSARSLSSVGSLGSESIGSTISGDCEEHNSVRKREKPRTSKSIETSRQSKSIDKLRRSTSIDKPRRSHSIDRTGSSESVVRDRESKRSGSVSSCGDRTSRLSSTKNTVRSVGKSRRSRSIDKPRRSESLVKPRRSRSIENHASNDSLKKERKSKRSGSKSSSFSDDTDKPSAIKAVVRRKESNGSDTGNYDQRRVSIASSDEANLKERDVICRELSAKFGDDMAERSFLAPQSLAQKALYPVSAKEKRIVHSGSTKTKDRGRSHLSIAAAAPILPHTNTKKVAGRRTSVSPERTSTSSSATKSWLNRIGEF